MTTIELGALCIQVGTASPLSLTLPGGISLSAVAGLEKGSALATVRGFLGQINAALAPLKPFFDVLNVVLAIKDCFEAVPKLLTNPLALVECIQKLAEAIIPLLGLIPQLSIPITIKGVLGVILAGLRGLRDELGVLIATQEQILAAAALAVLPGNEQLQAEVDCASARFATQMENVGAAMTPLNQLIELLNLLVSLAGMGSAFQIPTLEDLGPDPEAALAPLDASIDAIQIIHDLIPL